MAETILSIHSYLVHPAKNEDKQPVIGKAEIPIDGNPVYALLNELFGRAKSECNTEIVFLSNGGVQQNNCRDGLIRYIESPTLDEGHKIASELQQITTRRSGLGLVFLINGTIDGKKALMISRFPADVGMTVDEQNDNLIVKFNEKMFVKNRKAYKSVLYYGESLVGDFWKGHTVDTQISGAQESSDYWIKDFLQSQLDSTSKLGTERLSLAIKNAISKSDDPSIRSELLSATNLLKNKDSQLSSAKGFLQSVGLSSEAQEVVKNCYTPSREFEQSFQLDAQEMNKQLCYRVVELDNGAQLTAINSEFDDIFNTTPDSSIELDSVIEFTTRGKINNSKLKRTK